MYLYNSYCYPDMINVINSMQSKIILDGFGIIQTITQTGTDTLNINYQKPNNRIGNITVTIPTCDRLGFDNSYFGLTVADSSELAWGIILLLVIAFSFKFLKKTF